MFRTLVVALSLATASAFMGAPVTHRAAKTSSMSMSYEGELGAQRPLGFWVRARVEPRCFYIYTVSVFWFSPSLENDGNS